MKDAGSGIAHGNAASSNAAATEQAGKSTSQPMAMVIDLQSAELPKMATGDARAYFTRLGQRLDDMRASGIPVVWETMGRNSRLFEPVNNVAGARSEHDLKAAGFLNHAEGSVDDERLKIFTDFLRDHGPRTNEAMHVKYFKDPFMEPEDYADKPALKSTMQEQFGNAHPVPEPGAFPGKTLTRYVQEQKPSEILLMGGMSDHCIAEAAIGVGNKLPGVKATALRDLTLSWADEKPGAMPTQSVWRDTSRHPEAGDQFHEQKIRHGIRTITDRPERYSMTRTQAATLEANVSYSDSSRILQKYAAPDPRRGHHGANQPTAFRDGAFDQLLGRSAANGTPPDQTAALIADAGNTLRHRRAMADLPATGGPTPAISSQPKTKTI